MKPSVVTPTMQKRKFGKLWGDIWGGNGEHFNFVLTLTCMENMMPSQEGGSVFKIFFLSPRVGLQRWNSVFPRMEILEKCSNS